MKVTFRNIAKSLATTACLSTATSTLAGNVVGNGADSIDVGGATKIFDEIEYEESFMPNQLPDAWPAIEVQLTQIEGKLKKTGAYLRRILTGGMPIWWWIHTELKDIKDEGRTGIYVIYEKSQIAANTNNVIQINRELWDKLNVASKTSLIMHEALWTAVGDAYIGQGDNIRKLNRLLMNPSIGQYPAAALADYIKQFVGTANSPLAIMTDLDIEQLAVPPKFDVNDVVSDLGPQPVVTVTAEVPLKGLMLTSFKANPTAKNVYMKEGPWNDDFSIRTFTNDIGTGGVITQQPLSTRDLCAMNFGGYHDWRLPTIRELQDLRLLGLFSVAYPQAMTFRSTIEGSSSSMQWSVNGKLMYPVADSRGNAVAWILGTSDNGAIRAITPQRGALLGTTGSSFWPWYVEYICVRK